MWIDQRNCNVILDNQILRSWARIIMRHPCAAVEEGMCDLDEEELLEGIGDTVLGIRACDEVRPALDVFGGITHRYSHACQLDHLEVVVVVPDGDEVLWGLAEELEEASERAALIDSEGDELKEEVTGAEGTDTCSELLLDRCF